MSLSSATQTAITSLFGSARLLNLTNPRTKSPSSIDWTVVEACVNSLIAELAAVGTVYDETNNAVRRNWVLCVPDYDKPKDQREELAKFLERHTSVGLTTSSTGLADETDLDEPMNTERVRGFSRDRLNDIYTRGQARGGDDQRRRA